ncbi:glycosyltransferase [Merismopedia glauca]|uniref:Glycosyl transferase n=1 Tax=Merismopedia glauca CCAP 1448/3 TaxID=1296344 RepID=A0A2T1C7L9_9CYAN|nr:glycosyltransferase [Merismopedia glauca]PSB04137.1 glycosyl transferase [Merismopedia glauca CCAP 1448/3]
MLQIAIGTEASQYIPQKVLEFSIRECTTSLLDIRCLKQSEKRIGGTKFGFVRFHVPAAFGYQGTAIYLDADQIVLADLQQLCEALEDPYSLGLVRDLVGIFGDKPVPKRYETSVMVLNCNKLKSWQPETLFKNVVPNDAVLETGQMHYRDFMWLKWMDEREIQLIDSAWNHFNILQPDTKLVHFSHVASQPWKNPQHPLTGFWSQWLVKTLDSGFLKRRELLREIILRHIHPYFLKYCF